MSRKPANDWLLPMGGMQPESDEFLLDAYFDLRSKDDVGRMAGADTPKLRAATELMVLTVAGGPR